MPTKAELKEDLAAAQRTIAKLEEMVATAEQALMAAAKETSGTPAFVCFHAAGHLEGLGVVSAGMVMENPPAEALTRIPHTVIDAAKYKATAKRFGSGPTAPIGPRITTQPAGNTPRPWRGHRVKKGMRVTRTPVEDS